MSDDSKYNDSRQERQVIELLRERSAAPEDFRIVIARSAGTWEIIWETVDADSSRWSARGVGAAFAAAWDDVTDVRL